MEKVKIIECPRDAMQGIDTFIETETKAAYLRELLKVGFDTIDFGSFVSPKAIPQMRDTAELLGQVELPEDHSKMLAIVANERGALDVSKFEQVDIMGFPFSVSETFQQRNANSSISEAVDRLKIIQDICQNSGKHLVVYISMGFGNPYGDEWNVDIVSHWVRELIEKIEVRTISLSDTVGVGNPESIAYLFSGLIPEFTNVEFGAHLHTRPDNWREKVDAAFNSGCIRFDSAIKGYGGCPMAEDELVGNMATENLVLYFEEKGVETGIDKELFLGAMQKAGEVFPA